MKTSGEFKPRAGKDDVLRSDTRTLGIYIYILKHGERWTNQYRSGTLEEPLVLLDHIINQDFYKSEQYL
jgi:hypothetical protein